MAPGSRGGSRRSSNASSHFPPEAPVEPPSQPGTPRVELQEGSARVAWRPATRATAHRVCLTDFDRKNVGYLHVDANAVSLADDTASVVIPNVLGKYRVDVVGVNAGGLSAPRQCYFDCSRTPVRPEEVEALFSTADFSKPFVPPRRATRRAGGGNALKRPVNKVRDAQSTPTRTEKRRSFLDGPRRVEQYEDQGRYNYTDGPAPQADPGEQRLSKLAADVPPEPMERKVLRGPFAPRPEPVTPVVTKPSREKDGETDEEELTPRHAVSRKQKFVTKKTVDADGREQVFLVPDGFEQDDDFHEDTELELLQQRRRAEELALSLVGPELKKEALFNYPFEEWTTMSSPDVPNVMPRGIALTNGRLVLSTPSPRLGADSRQLGPTAAAPEEQTPLMLSAEVREDNCTLRWSWRGKPQGIAAYTMFGAKWGDRWTVVGRLQYGESSYTARRLPRGQAYAFVLYATPIGTFDEGWVSAPVKVEVQPGRPDPPTGVELSVEDGDVMVSWAAPVRASLQDEEIVAFRVRTEDLDGQEGQLLCEVPRACTCLSWPFGRYQGGAALSVASVSLHDRESDRIPSVLQVQDAAKAAPVLVPEVAVSETAAAINVEWQSTDPLTRYTILLRLRGHREIRRFPVLESPTTIPLGPGTDVSAALEADSPATGPRVSDWSPAVQLKARAPNAPGRPTVRQAGDFVHLAWTTPTEMRQQGQDVTYIILIEAEDGRRVEVQGTPQPFWCARVDDLMEHFYRSRLRFAIVAVGSAGRSPQSWWTTKFVFLPSGEWAVRHARRVGAIEARPTKEGAHTGPHSTVQKPEDRMFLVTSARMGTGPDVYQKTPRLPQSGNAKDPDLAYSTRVKKISPAFLASASRSGGMSGGRDWESYLKIASRATAKGNPPADMRERPKSPPRNYKPSMQLFPPRPW